MASRRLPENGRHDGDEDGRIAPPGDRPLRIAPAEFDRHLLRARALRSEALERLLRLAGAAGSPEARRVFMAARDDDEPVASTGG